MTSTTQNYQAVLQQLETIGNYENTAKSRDISKLIGIQTLLEELSNPHQAFNVVHLAGTNGKGLTATMLAKIFQSEGKTTGVYSSPHVLDIRERILLNGELVSQEAFARNATKVLEAAEVCSQKVFLSFFDILTATAFMVFQEAKLDWIVLETGLGGKADSTNVTKKKLCILTLIDRDHMTILGDTLEAIASEKIGIVRSGFPTVLAHQNEALQPWLQEQLQTLNSPAIWADSLELKFEEHSYTVQWPDGQMVKGNHDRDISKPFAECWKTALMARETLSPGTLKERQNWCQAALSAQLRGRLEWFEGLQWKANTKPFPKVLLDGGHNPSAMGALVSELKQRALANYVLILGLGKDKLIPPLLEALIPLCQKAKIIYLTQAQSIRAASPEQISKFIQEHVPQNAIPPVESFNSLPEALEKASLWEETPLVVTGSFYLIGEFHQLIGSAP